MTLLGFVVKDLLRNPRRTITSLVGVLVGVGLFSAVLFFIDGSGASMTRRALAPLALDMQLVSTAPLGGGIRLEHAFQDVALQRGETTLVTLVLSNDGIAPAHEVVVRDFPGDGLAYVVGSTSVDGVSIADVGGSPLRVGAAGTGLNLGTLLPAAGHRVTYRVTAVTDIASIADLTVNATVSSREAVAPRPANTPPAESLVTLADRVATLDGVQAANPLIFVDMENGALTANGARVPGPVKLFAFDSAYAANYPSITVVDGEIRDDGALISVETAQVLGLHIGDAVDVVLPGGMPPLSVAVSGIADLSTATPLFASRESSRLEKFLYVPFSIAIGHDLYRTSVEPAFEAAAAARGTTIGSLPVEELDVLLDRSMLNADPATANAQTQKVASAVLDTASGQAYLIDNISNTLLVAEGDADVAKRLFVFLGFPGAILAGIITAYAGNLLAEAQRRENGLLRIRGATRKHLLHLLALRTVAIAGVGSLLGTALGFLVTLAILGPDPLFQASQAALAQSAAIGIAGGLLVTAFALYVPGRRLITSELKQEIAELPRRTVPAWRRYHLDLLVLVGAGIAQFVAYQWGAFDAPPGSVYAGRSVTLPLQLLIAPLVAWLAGSVFIARVLQEITWRSSSAYVTPRFGRLLPGVLWRSITRRLGAVTVGMLTLGLIVGLATMLACFASVYHNAERADARFLVGSDIRLTPSPANTDESPSSLASDLMADGISGATPVVYSLENAVLTSAFNEDVASLAAIDPETYPSIADLQDSLFTTGTASGVMSALKDRSDGVLVNVALAEGLKLKVGDPAEVLLARDTDRQTRVAVTVVGLFTRFPGSQTGTDIVANLELYQTETDLDVVDYYLVESIDRSDGGLQRAAQALTGLPGIADRFVVQTSVGALNTDQSSLTALNVRDLLRIDSFFTLLMAGTATAMFVFGMLLQRRREYVTMLAQGMPARDVRALVLAESGISAVVGTVIGLAVGIVMASQFVQVLRPIFTLAPPLEVPLPELLMLGAIVLGATTLSSIAANIVLGRLKPTELLRDE